MNWALARHFPWIDTRARFVAATPQAGALLDLGSSDGETLGHFAELRPDLHFFAADKVGQPERYPAGCQFQRVDFERERLPWPDRSMDAITCMQLIEHMQDLTLLLAEAARLIKPGGRIFFETPHPKTLALPSLRGTAAGTFTMNFFDDPTHIRVVAMDALAQQLRGAGLEVVSIGISRNWVFVAAWPLYFFAPPSRKKFTARVHWIGWSACLVARRPL
jgi:SAM-dependent methyltransferase